MLTINELSKEQVLNIINQAIKLKKQQLKLNNHLAIANIFVEPSTRTKISFEKAERELGMDVYNLDYDHSSFKKSESLYDTIMTLKSYDIHNYVIRSSTPNYWDELKSIPQINIINAGDGKNNHPTQALLDAMTIFEHFHTLENLNILICGDVKNSRVYHSFTELISKFNSNLMVASPKVFQEQDGNIKYVKFNDEFVKADVVMMLRIQFERHSEHFDAKNYNVQYGLDNDKISKMKSNAIFMHPGPINRGIEIAENVSYQNPKNKILEQVKNGIYIRKIILGGKY